MSVALADGDRPRPDGSVPGGTSAVFDSKREGGAATSLAAGSSASAIGRATSAEKPRDGSAQKRDTLSASDGEAMATNGRRDDVPAVRMPPEKRNGDTADESGSAAQGDGEVNNADSGAETAEVAVLPSNANPDETNVWPDEAAEAAFISETRGRGENVVPVAAEVIDEVEDSRRSLPPLDELVRRIPAETRELLEELFRAKFVAVRRVRKSDLKPAEGT